MTACSMRLLSRASGWDDQALEVARVVRQDLDPVLGYEHRVRVAEAAVLGRVQAGLDGEDHPRPDLRRVSGVEERAFVVAKPDRVARVVPPVREEVVVREVRAD